MKRATKITTGFIMIGVIVVATKFTKSKLAKNREIKKVSAESQDKINYKTVENLILEAEKIKESEIGKRAFLSNDVTVLSDKEELLNILDVIYLRYYDAEKYLNKIKNKEGYETDKIKLLINRRKKVIEHRKIFLNK